MTDQGRPIPLDARLTGPSVDPMRATLMLAGLLIATLSGPGALRAEVALDDPEADRNLLSTIENLYRSGPLAPGASGDTTRTPEVDAHVAVREAHALLLHRPQAPEASRLAELLAVPDFLDRPDAPSAPSAGQPAALKTPHFRIFWYGSGEHAVPADDGDGNGIPDRVEWVAEAFELAYRREIEEFGYPAPPDCPEYRVVLKRLEVNALTHPMGGGRTYCEFNFAMREKGTEAQIRGKYRAVAAHEFFHAVQALYNWEEEHWWSEGSADWMSELVDPGNGFFRLNAALRFQRPEIGLASTEPFFPYAGSLFAGYLTPVGTKGPDLVKDVWVEVGRRQAAAQGQGSKRRKFVREAMDKVLGSFEAAVVRFWPHVYLRNFPGGKDLPRASRLTLKDYPADVAASSLPRPDPLGANFFELHPPAGGGALKIRVEPLDQGARYAARVVALSAERWTSNPMEPGADGAPEIVVEGLGTTWRAACVVVVNLGRSKSGFRVRAQTVP